MHLAIIIAAGAIAQPSPAPEGETILVTGSLRPAEAPDVPVSATVFDNEEIEALALANVSDLLRLAPGASIASTGPRGTQTQLRIRGAEANHSLLFIDGIRFNDPAAGNEARFELLSSDTLSRIELVRGPQSALWGSEALGGVVAVESADPLRRPGASARAEYGSLDSYRAALQGAQRLGVFGLSGAAAISGSDGIDSFGSGGERDGFESRAATLKAVLAPLPATEFGLVGHWIEGRSDFDGFDPTTFRRADTLDSTRNRMGAVRGWASAVVGKWSLDASASLLGSANRNSLDDQPINRTFGERLTYGGSAAYRTGPHHLIAAFTREEEEFRARDDLYGGATDQDRSRGLTAFVGQWRARWSDWLSTDLALRHDDFSAFADATNVRAALIVQPRPEWTIHAAYGEGIAQPTFYDLYGFFPGSFQGNPGLKPERSRGWELGFRWRSKASRFVITAFSNRLTDEIIDTFDPSTFLSSTVNADGTSRRRGIEVEAGQELAAGVSASINYTYLDSGERRSSGDALVREVRRPRHSANATIIGTHARWQWSTALAYVGTRIDSDFDLFPASRVRLGDYLLASARIGYRVTRQAEIYARVENGLGADYQDVVGYSTAGRTVYAGVRLHFGS